LEYFENGTVQLFNLKNDIGEEKDLSKVEIEKTKELQKILHEWLKKVAAKKMEPNPNYDASLKSEEFYKYKDREMPNGILIHEDKI
jgi:hypothetical protein